MSPVWLLDIDGVLNATKPGWSAPPRQKHVVGDGQSWRLRWAPALIDRVRAIHRTGLAEIRWCSTWCPDAEGVERAFGLGPFGLALTPEEALARGETTRAAKTSAALAVVREGRRLVWTDDDAIPELGPEREELDAAGALLIAPSPRTGLQREDLDQIEAFLAVPALPPANTNGEPR